MLEKWHMLAEIQLHIWNLDPQNYKIYYKSLKKCFDLCHGVNHKTC